ncbi:glucose 1-dehydrogenase [Flavihumibacter sp. RY-1]|uniref:Glucose 1-dehydrogenase n=1 Tax=Flavihumibacter fluminis TaxID=2909236 RepID=A0ABS9BCT8_9BACT|nr:glucose 1-dehydrogenase [Flavihumibacter fluminis]MCF1713070.1 glucose 1-dehydrogenase [Flavihumibacter fluminis]
MAILENKVAIVTGAGSGIGRAIARFYAREGAKVVVSDINQAGGEETVKEIHADGGIALFFKADTSSIEDNRLLVEKAVQEFGGLHIACNNAGIGGPMGPTADYPIDGWNKVIGINLSGVFYGMHFQVAAMLKSGGGAIVNIASILGAVGTRFSPAYVAAKHGVVGLTKATALEYASQGVRVNSIGPGYILTPLLTNALDEAAMEQVKSLHPIGRLGTSEEVAELALWLSSDKASFVTGSYYAVDGGYLAQ